MQPPKCTQCGRPLKDPVSIARGMEPECAGTSSRGRKSTPKIRRSHGKAYAFSSPFGQITLPVFVEETEARVEELGHE
ncbi:MAG: hypothetical protein HUU38_03125 [Anaerolineales bacterium]|nr:hypothetical protein [Anaerolineales bacterium]